MLDPMKPATPSDLSELTEKCDERIGGDYTSGTRLARIRVGSIGVALTEEQTGIASPHPLATIRVPLPDELTQEALVRLFRSDLDLIGRL